MSKRMFVLGLVFLFVLTLAGDAFAKPVKLEYNLAKGDSAKYLIKMDSKTSIGYQTKIEKIDIQSSMAMVQRVIDRDEKEGTMYLLTSIEDVKSTVNGMPVDPAQNKTAEKVFTMHIKPSGEIVDAQGLQTEMSMQQMQLSFPNKPVDVGTRWEHTIPANKEIKVPLLMKYEVVGFKTVDGHECAVIKSNVVSAPKEKTQESLDVKADGEIVFAYTEGKIVENKVTGTFGSVSIQDIGGQPQPIVTKVEIKLEMKLGK